MQSIFICSIALVGFSLAAMSGAHDSLPFSLALYKAVVKTAKADQNIAISPFSVDAALCMTYIGAAGTTKSELATALGIQANEMASSLAADFKSVTSSGQNFTFQTANALFLDKTFVIRPKYQTEITNDFGGNITSVDFANAAEAARKQINAYVASKTSDKVTDLLPENSLDSDTKSVLANAVYFKAAWENIFDAEQTAVQPFTLANGKQKNVSLMTQTGRFGYTEIESLGWAQFVELRYKGLEASMVLILPQNQTGMATLEAGLTPAVWDSTIPKLARTRKVQVSLPKFRLNVGARLLNVLKAMGIKTAFGNGADFSLISQQPVFVTKVEHKVFIEVDEKGTTAAAATAVEDGTRSFPSEFRADRPFLFFVRHVQSKAILFAGRIADPTVEI